MRIYYKQRPLSMMGDAEIYDEYNHIIYSVKGKLAFLPEYRIMDARMHPVGTVKRAAASFAPKYDIFLGNNYIGSITKESTFGRSPIYHIDYNGWTIKVSSFEKEYFFFDKNGNSIAHAGKDTRSLSDAYMIDIIDDGDGDGEIDADPISAIMFIVAIDSEKASRSANC